MRPTVGVEVGERGLRWEWREEMRGDAKAETGGDKLIEFVSSRSSCAGAGGRAQIGPALKASHQLVRSLSINQRRTYYDFSCL